MGLSEFDPGARERISLNAGRKVGAKRALKPRQIWAIRFFLDQHGRIRDRALFDLAIDSKLPGCDLVKIRIIVRSPIISLSPSSWNSESDHTGYFKPEFSNTICPSRSFTWASLHRPGAMSVRCRDRFQYLYWNDRKKLRPGSGKPSAST
ncbi:hypothetical protein EDF59_14429 [Novosphingobium sp. ST904]|nr:hypothetical protein EDF59_14429 [Novosphingobium sp. ST904]